ncbi:hypothetical protein F1D05_36405 [Kribbella qitaiheensis]|uniref:Recombinase family protein n=1 Tax=Kribbella qitaiheensis TaxID=1544730 RepID=A0A7G6X815_9ACTN|nr:hypothetical protein [Kribbella qitaiheensis]QNE22380.1 hypothetical protein F1D05_36405 [Kribbella qitaiheensis]
MSATEMARAQDGLLKFATQKGFNIDHVEIFVEKLETVPDAFQKLIEKMTAQGERTVIIPGIHHLAGLGSPPLAVVEAFTADGVHVLVAGHVE